MPDTATWEPGDEHRHAPGDGDGWHEGWTFDFWLTGDASGPGGTGGSTALVLWPLLGRAWYWAMLVRPGAPLLHLADLDVTLPRRGLEIRADGLWATHVCEAPFEQWTVANEAYAVALDDPDEALGRAHGDPAPVAFDLEWYASAEAVRLDGTTGYRQEGEVHGIVELAGGRLALEAAARRAHWWGDAFPWTPAGTSDQRPPGPRAPVALAGGVVLDRVLTAHGWWERISRRETDTGLWTEL